MQPISQVKAIAYQIHILALQLYKALQLYAFDKAQRKAKS